MHPDKIKYQGQLYVLAFKGSPDEYKREHGKCPVGFHWDGKKCIELGDAKVKGLPKTLKTKTKAKFIPATKLKDRTKTKYGKDLHMQIGLKSKVMLNPNYDPKKDDTYYAVSINEDGKKARHYTDDFVGRNKRAKFKANKALSKKIVSIRKGYTTDLGSSDPSRRYHALAVALVDKALFRIGNKTSEQDNKVQGLHNLKLKNVKIKGSKAVFDYIGKHQIKQHHEVNDPKIVKRVKELMKGKGSKDYLFSWQTAEGKDVHMTPAGLNGYFKHRLGSPVSVHKLRSFHATRMAKDALDETPPSEVRGNQKKLLKWFREKMSPIAKALGHNSVTTTMNYYVDPTVTSKFFNKHNAEMPKTILAEVMPTTGWEVSIKTEAITELLTESEMEFIAWLNTTEEV